jgi:hypothetical protein
MQTAVSRESISCLVLPCIAYMEGALFVCIPRVLERPLEALTYYIPLFKSFNGSSVYSACQNHYVYPFFTWYKDISGIEAAYWLGRILLYFVHFIHSESVVGSPKER